MKQILLFLSVSFSLFGMQTFDKNQLRVSLRIIRQINGKQLSASGNQILLPKKHNTLRQRLVSSCPLIISIQK